MKCDSTLTAIAADLGGVIVVDQDGNGSFVRHCLAVSGLFQGGEGVPPLFKGPSRPEGLQGRERDSDSLTFHCSACSGFPHA